MIRTRSVEFMPFYLSLATFLMSISFFAYGMLLHDFFIYVRTLKILDVLIRFWYSRSLNFRFTEWYHFQQLIIIRVECASQIPNGIGTVLGVVQLLLYAYYSKSVEESRLPLVASHWCSALTRLNMFVISTQFFHNFVMCELCKNRKIYYIIFLSFSHILKPRRLLVCACKLAQHISCIPRWLQHNIDLDT